MRLKRVFQFGFSARTTSVLFFPFSRKLEGSVFEGSEAGSEGLLDVATWPNPRGFSPSINILFCNRTVTFPAKWIIINNGRRFHSARHWNDWIIVFILLSYTLMCHDSKEAYNGFPPEPALSTPPQKHLAHFWIAFSRGQMLNEHKCCTSKVFILNHSHIKRKRRTLHVIHYKYKEHSEC